MPGLLSSIFDFAAGLCLGWYLIMIAMAISGGLIALKKFNTHPIPLPALNQSPSPSASVPSSSASSSSSATATSNQIPKSKISGLIPSVSILRPLCGLDFDLKSNLESTFQLNWPNDRFEILFCLNYTNLDHGSGEDNEPEEFNQIEVILNDLFRQYPHVRARLLKSNENIGVNPKINNLMQAYRIAQSDLLWILDSNITIHPNTLARAIALLDPPIDHNINKAHQDLNTLNNHSNIQGKKKTKINRRRVGLVHHVPVGLVSSKHPLSWGSLVESTFLNTNHTRQYLVLNSVSVASCLVGKSNLFYRSDIEIVSRKLREKVSRHPREPRFRESETGQESQPMIATHYNEEEAEQDDNEELSMGKQKRFEGLAWFGQFLGEDNMIGQSLWDNHIRHAISIDVVGNVLGPISLHDYIERRVRWIRARKYMTFLSTLLEPFTESMVLGILTILSLIQLKIIKDDYLIILILFISHLKFFMLIDYLVYYRSILSTDLMRLSTTNRSLNSNKKDNQDGIEPDNNDEDDKDRLYLKMKFKEFVFGWYLRESLALYVWFKAMVSNQVRWRNFPGKFKVLSNGRSTTVL